MFGGCTALNPGYDGAGGSSGARESSGPERPGSSGGAPEPGEATTEVGGTGAGESLETGPGGSESTGAPRCGDAVVDDTEVCDDGVNDGGYGGCKPGCGALAPRCGDGHLDDADGETCDDGNEDSTDGCASICRVPVSCLELHDIAPELDDGIYEISPEGSDLGPFSVYCDMVTDGGGYTFFENSVAGATVSAAEAEMVCGLRGMQLWIPRTASHLDAAWEHGTTLGGAAPYLRIFGVYPSVPEGACSNEPFNSGNDACLWRASDDGPYWIHDSTSYSEPSGDNPLDQSAVYDWSPSGELTYLDDLRNADDAEAFFCDVGDKQGP